MVDVFISYKREERQRCERIYAKLKALDLDVWFDERLTSGKSFDREIEAAVRAAKAVMVLWSPASVESEWVREEASVGKTRGALAAIRISRCDLPFGFGSTHCEDIYEADFVEDHPAWLRILERIGALTRRPGLADFSRAFGQAAALLQGCADSHPTDPLAAKARLSAVALPGPVATGILRSASSPTVRLSGAAARWAEIENSLEPEDYTDFLDVFPRGEEAFEARRQKRRLEAWAATDQADQAAVTAFLRSGSFAALQAAVQNVVDHLAAAAERPRLLAIPALANAYEARAAAVGGRAVTARSFTIELSGVAASRRPVMVAVPPGRFLMGSPTGEERWVGYDGEEEPVHEVRIDHVVAIGRSAVTVDAFAAFVAETNHDAGDSAHVPNSGKWENTPGRDWRKPGFAQTGEHPVTCVNWHDAQAFMAWLNDRLELIGRPDAYRLPSEAEWEFACRAGTLTAFSFGDAITADQVNFNDREAYGGAEPTWVWRQSTTPLGQFPANAFGLYDMHGNSWDWCEDAWTPSYAGRPTDGSAERVDNVALRIIRGGSWYSYARHSRSAARHRSDAAERANNVGFRLARTLSPEAA